MDKPCFRIIDANFNRAREALRMMEDYCRFALNSGPLSGRLKQLRHELSAAIGTLDAARLLAARDTLADVGVGQKVEGQLARTSLAESFTAAAKRLTEALRVLAETIQPHNHPLAAALERLRYDAYTLEKDIVVFATPAAKFARVRLYVIISNDFPVDVLSLAARCAAGGADCLQLRAKAIPDDRLFALAVEFADICRESGVLSIINDRPDIAIAAGADGVHLGQNDLPIEQTRRLQLTPLVIGKSTHTPKELDRAIPSRPAYVSLGPVFPTPTKPALTPAGLEYLKQGLEALADTGVAHVAIGGITRKNVDQVIHAGARCVAVCSAVTDTPDPSQSCRLLKAKIADLLPE
jgi:thiamine-phosphate pyrophosphorylase